MTWIPVSERLPEDGIDVIACNVTTVLMDRFVARFYSWRGVWIHKDEGGAGPCAVTHWQPLPEPPEKEGAWSKS